MLRMTEEEYREYLRRTGLPDVIEMQRRKQQASQEDPVCQEDSEPRKNKYFNQRVYVYQDGMASVEPLEGRGHPVEVFDSVKEYQRCQELRLMERAGAISELKTQVVLVIQEKFKSHDGKTYRAITYRADFTYVQNGIHVVEDVKGYSEKKKKYLTTEAFRLKWKLLIARYPEYKFQIF